MRYFSSIMTRALSGCKGRLLLCPMIFLMVSICPLLALTGVSKTIHLTPSLQGGVVSEPFRRKWAVDCGYRAFMLMVWVKDWPGFNIWASNGLSAGLLFPSLNITEMTVSSPVADW